MTEYTYKDHTTRDMILEYIGENPGATFVTLKNVFRLSESTLRYHLDYMMKKRRIALEKEGGKRCYYPYVRKCYPYPQGKVELNNEQQRLLDIISISPGISYRDLKVRSGLSNGTFTYNLNRLKEVRLVWRRRRDDGTGYEVVTRERIADSVFLLLLHKYLDGHLDRSELEDFFTKLEEYRNQK